MSFIRNVDLGHKVRIYYIYTLISLIVFPIIAFLFILGGKNYVVYIIFLSFMGHAIWFGLLLNDQNIKKIKILQSIGFIVISVLLIFISTHKLEILIEENIENKISILKICMGAVGMPSFISILLVLGLLRLVQYRR